MLSKSQLCCTFKDLENTTFSVEAFKSEVECGSNYLASTIYSYLTDDFRVTTTGSNLHVPFFPNYENIAWLHKTLLTNARILSRDQNHVNIPELLNVTLGHVSAEEAWVLLLPGWIEALCETDLAVIRRIEVRGFLDQLIKILYEVVADFNGSSERKPAFSQINGKSWHSEIAPLIKRGVTRLNRVSRDHVDSFRSSQGYDRPLVLTTRHNELMQVVNDSTHPKAPAPGDTIFDLINRMRGIGSAVEALEGLIEVLSVEDYYVKGVPPSQRRIISAFSVMQKHRSYHNQAYLVKHGVINKSLALDSLIAYLRKTRSAVYHRSLDQNLDVVAQSLILVGTVNG